MLLQDYCVFYLLKNNLIDFQTARKLKEASKMMIYLATSFYRNIFKKLNFLKGENNLFFFGLKNIFEFYFFNLWNFKI